MAANKYSRDYRLLEQFDEKGRVRTDYEYIGEYWSFVKDDRAVADEKRKALLLTAFAGAAFVMSLIPYSGMMHRLYIALPYIFILLPLFMTADLVIALQRFKAPMEHRYADKLNNAYPARTLAVLYLSAIAFTGELVFLFTAKEPVPGDYVMAFCTALIAVCAFCLFGKRKSFLAAVKKDDRGEK